MRDMAIGFLIGILLSALAFGAFLTYERQLGEPQATSPAEPSTNTDLASTDDQPSGLKDEPGDAIENSRENETKGNVRQAFDALEEFGIDVVGEWIVRADTNPLDDSRTVSLINSSEEGRTSLGDAITLVLRCSSGETEAYINWHDYLGNDDTVSVTSRIGSGDAKTSAWGNSTDNQGTFFRDGGTRQFIGSLMEADSFVARTTPYNESPVTAVWDLDGLAEAVMPLREACEW